MSRLTTLPPKSGAELALSVERAYREAVILDRLGALWSLILAKCFLAQWAINQYQIPISGLRYIWSLTLIMALLATVMYLRAHHLSLRLFPNQFRVGSAILGGLLVSGGFIFYAHYALSLLSFASAMGIAAALMGTWSLARASLRFAYEPLCGTILWWILAGYTLRGSDNEALAWVGLGFLLAQSLPGFALVRRTERRMRI